MKVEQMQNLALSLLDEMDSQLRVAGDRLAFVQLRVSAESFVRNECAIAISRIVYELPYHVHMEKKVQGKIVDIIVVPVTEGKEDFKRAIQFELKMAWPGALQENASGVSKDLDALAGRDSAYAVALFFAFQKSPSWTPYKPSNIDFNRGLAQFIKEVDAGEPVFYGEPFLMISSEAVGRGQLVAWRA